MKDVKEYRVDEGYLILDLDDEDGRGGMSLIKLYNADIEDSAIKLIKY